MASRVLKRFSSTATTTFTAKATPSKAHFHQPIPSSDFPKGYLLSGTHAGVKKNASAHDLALLLSQSPRTSAAAVFTANAFRAAPVVVSEEILAQTTGRARALVVNSGCANAVTGAQGMKDARAMVSEADALLPEPSSSPRSLVMSTGVIGQTLPIERIVSGIRAAAPTLGSDFQHWEAAARAFMTTDTFPKIRARSFTLGGRTFRIAGISKGAGMIHPHVVPPSLPKQLHATLLAAFATDAPVSPSALQSALNFASQRSFNAISVDGDMSTNDTVVLFANGAGVAEGEMAEIREADEHLFKEFTEALIGCMQELAQLVVRDGEGATKFVTITVDGATNYEDAHKIASRISTSALVKTALYGEDANWGRILAATGSIPLNTPLDPTAVSVSLVPPDGSAPLPLLTRGEPRNVDEERAKEILIMEDVELRVDLGLGKESARVWTCDFSYEYVRINGDYRS
ncbi:Arginine biosynthesis bifunctional protein ArgJ beta chain [Amylostereum chailletii]|nr:Arginine biosynthesis bifunctional protein ArgJ beta chain [Amylostereum chailletii]